MRYMNAFMIAAPRRAEFFQGVTSLKKRVEGAETRTIHVIAGIERFCLSKKQLKSKAFNGFLPKTQEPFRVLDKRRDFIG